MSPYDATSNIALGLDMGGTNIRAAVVTRDGQIIARQQMPTPQNAEGYLALPPVLVEALAACAQPLLDAYTVAGVGLGAGGQYDPQTGMLRGISTPIPGFVNYPLGEKLRHRLGLAVYVDSDVKMATFGELRVGAGRGFRHLIGVAIGTGVGGALVLNGQLFHGNSGLAGHIGQIPDLETGTYVEALAGGVPLSQSAVEKGILPSGSTSRELFALARAGNPDAQALIKRAGIQLGRALAGLVHVFEPEAVLVGGSVGVQSEYLEALNRGMAGSLMPNWRHITARPMALGPDAGQIGASQRVFMELGL